MIKTAADAASTPDATGTLPSSPLGAAPPQVIAERYEIERELGQGGMGHVYLATDRKLARKVAIKVLSGAHGDEALQRFELEARAAGSLNHPNVLAVYDIGAHESGPYLVSELLEGQTLRQRMSGKPLPLRKALDYAVQLAQGLSAAHEKGVIHRDLKPDNLFITSEGRLKILDFGIAKLVGEKRAGPITATGTIMGTVEYMSPEQVRGERADHRTDIFSFGVILHEMLSGKAPFERHTPMETGSAILHDDPPPLPPSTPEALDAIVHRCLEKDPRERFQSANDLAFQLASIHVTGTGARRAHGAPGPRVLRRAAVAMAIAAAAALGYALGRRALTHEPPTFTRLSTLEDWPLAARFAPDGFTVLYTGNRGPRRMLSSTRLDRPHTTPLGIEDAFVHAISPRGEVALIMRPGRHPKFGALQGTLAFVSIAGGAPREAMEDVVAADYLPDGALTLLRHKIGEADWKLEFPAGHNVYTGQNFLGAIRVSPDGRFLAVADQPLGPRDDRGFISIIDRAGKLRRLTPEWTSVQGVGWSPRGDEVWFGASPRTGGSNLYAVTLDGRVRVLAGATSYFRLLDVDARGRALVTETSYEQGIRCLAPGATVERECAVGEASVGGPLSHDGRTVLMSDEGQNEGPSYGLYLAHTDGSAPIRLGDGSGSDLSPDGKWALGNVSRDGRAHLVLYPTGPGAPRELAVDPSFQDALALFFPDGKRLAVIGFPAQGLPRVVVTDLEGTPLQSLGEVRGRLAGITRDGNALILWQRTKLALRPVAGGAALELDLSSIPEWSFVGEDSSGDFLVADSNPLARGQEKVTIWRVARDGQRTVAREIRSPIPDATTTLVRLSDDGKAYALAYMRAMSRLYLVEGLR